MSVPVKRVANGSLTQINADGSSIKWKITFSSLFDKVLLSENYLFSVLFDDENINYKLDIGQ